MKSKKAKKSKKEKKVVDDDDDATKSSNAGKDNEQTQQADEDAARKERKRLRKLRKEKDASAKATPEATVTSVPSKKTTPKPEDKLHKSKKKDAKPEKSASSGNGREQATASAEQWNPDALSGDAARKSKFLRLLGAGKSAGSDASTKPARSSGGASTDIQRVESELERQFEAGIRMKHGGQSKRMGLGA